MRILNTQIFDDVITSTGVTWYSPADMNDSLGAADGFAIQACTTLVGGTLPTLTVQAEHSGDGENWIATPSAEISGVLIANSSTFVGWREMFNSNLVPLANLRFRITLGGTAPQCRLRLYFTGRVWNGRRPQAPQGSRQSKTQSTSAASQPSLSVPTHPANMPEYRP